MKLTLKETRPEVENVETFVFEAAEPVSWQPGQYMHYVFPHPDEDDRGEERWFTISSPPYQKNITITTRFTDDQGSSFKTALKGLKPGESIEADGPKGKFVIEDLNKEYVLMAGGIGITPYHSMLLQFDHDGKMPAIELLYANRDEKFVFDKEFNDLAAKYPNLHIKKFVGDRHIEAEDLKPYADDQTKTIYLSGPEPMIEAFEQMLQEMGVPEERLKTDFFPGYEPE
ncbi:MAG TPA: FAD-dependent oxidoreductase [Candidatus Saccharimonadales bacterium]|nr:FAD-dependent oxidoreductase [Candidatus Saccharimonadales bacterium]